jgi:4'-phosphopantetheinyl transferase
MSLTIDLWVWNLDVDDTERKRLTRFLSNEELSRIERFVFEHDRKRFKVCRGRAREILGTQLSCPPSELHFDYSPNGKPSVRGTPVHFNVSHSHGVAAMALSERFELGADIERIRPLEIEIADRFFSPREVEALRRLPSAEQPLAILRCWTRKEAIVKAMGKGLSHSLQSFDVSVAEDEPVVNRLAGDPDPTNNWQLADFTPTECYVGTIACRTGGISLAVRKRYQSDRRRAWR